MNTFRFIGGKYWIVPYGFKYIFWRIKREFDTIPLLVPCFSTKKRALLYLLKEEKQQLRGKK